MKILIVEDEAITALSMEATLQDHGHEVVAIADDESSAIRAAAEHTPELALVDMRLSRGDCGLSVARHLRERGVVVVFATGNCPGQDLGNLALGCLHKPISDDQLVRSLVVAEARARQVGNPPPPPPGMHLFAQDDASHPQG